MLSNGTFPEIARWWRQVSKKTFSADTTTDDPCLSSRNGVKRLQSTNPSSILLQVTRTKEGVAFVRGRVRALRGELRLANDPSVRVHLALYLEKLGEDHLDAALKEMDDALRSMSRTPDLARRSGCRPTSGNDVPFHAWAKSERVRLAKAREALLVRQKALRAVGEPGLSPVCPLSAVGKKRRRSEFRVAAPSDGCTRSSDDEDGSRDGICTGSSGSAHEEGPVIAGTSRGWSSVPLSVSRPSASSRFRAVDERDASSLTYEEFIEVYARPGIPVILKGGVALCFEGACPWGRERLLEVAGDKTVPVRRRVADSVSWARLEDAGHKSLKWVLGEGEAAPESKSGDCCTLINPGVAVSGGAATAFSASGQSSGARRSTITKGEASDGFSGGEARWGLPAGSGATGVTGATTWGGGSDDSRELLYLHDWSLPQNLGLDSSLLAGSFKVPRFFAGDVLQRVAGRGLPYTDSWPSLFVGPRGSMSDTHVDSFGSHFWMALLEGKKRWILFPREESALLYPRWSEGCHDPVFDADVETPDEEFHPAAVLARGFECVLEAGDLLFVPAGSSHRVENVTDTLALSCNYVDATNLEAALAALDDQALVDHGAGALASALRSCDPSLCRQQHDVSWADLKRFPRDGEVADWVIDATQ